MEHNQEQHASELIELGSASADTHGGPIGVVEVIGFRAEAGLSDE